MESILVTKSKKGQISTLSPAIVALVVAAIFLVLGLVILQEMRDIDVIKKANSGSIVNETLTTVTETGEKLAAIGFSGGVCGAVSQCVNASDGIIIPTANYTASGCSVKYSATAGLPFNNTNWKCSYSYTHGDEAYRGANKTLAGLVTFGDFWSIIVLAIVASIVIGLILYSFSKKSR